MYQTNTRLLPPCLMLLACSRLAPPPVLPRCQLPRLAHSELCALVQKQLICTDPCENDGIVYNRTGYIYYCGKDG